MRKRQRVHLSSLFQVEEDQLNWHGGFRARHSYVLLESCDYAVNNLPNITLPVLVMQGSMVRPSSIFVSWLEDLVS
jgi:hypothetical protein